ncbi:MAG: cysteine desulfurase [Candidatus Berkiella sp.]
MSTRLDVNRLRQAFPCLNQMIHGHPLIYFDNAATTQKPEAVIRSLSHFFQHNNANIHRGIYTLSENATQAYEDARAKVAQFIHAKYSKECVFVRGTTEGINLVANGWLDRGLKANDEIVISQIEHHSNIVPWQGLCEKTGALLRIIPCNELGELDLDAYRNILNERTKLVAITHVANSIGTINPIKAMTEIAHSNGSPVLIDGAQAVAHLKVDVTDLDCDFYAFSGHKLYGPTGIGVLYGKSDWLDRLPPYQRGGDMISSVSFEKSTFQAPPYKFEAGTPAIGEAISLGSAIEFVEKIGRDNIAEYEQALLTYANQQLIELPALKVIGQAKAKAPIIAFTLADIHPHDIATALDRSGVAIRSGHLCAQPAIEHFGVKSVARASFAMYNTFAEIDSFVVALHDTLRLFKR